jgi:hypothetical protein
MHLLHFFGSALLRSDRGDQRNKADAPTRTYSEREIEEGEAQQDGTKNKNSWSVMGLFLAPRQRSPSPSPSPSGSLPPSEYNSLDSEKKSKCNLPLAFPIFSFQKLPHSRTFWISLGIAIMVLLTTLLTTVLVLTHARRAHANIDFTVDLGYSKYVGAAAADDKIVKWLGIRYAAPPVGNNRFRAPQDPVVDGKTIQANTVCLASSL